MPKLWSRRFKSYDVARLVNHRILEDSHTNKNNIHIICDIDKTYLETEFGSFIKIAKIAFESAQDKITVAGSNEVLMTARWGHTTMKNSSPNNAPKFLHFVSSSPPQLRSVLEKKMIMDRINWSTDTFKNQAYNLKKGRLDLLRQHVAYKTTAILQLIASSAMGSEFYLIGDNAETDAYVYVGIALFILKYLSPESYQKYLELAGVDEQTAQKISGHFSDINSVEIKGIFIRNAPGYQFLSYEPLTDPILHFEHFYVVACAFIICNLIPVDQLWQLTRSFHNHHNFSRQELAQWLLNLKASVNSNSTIANACTETLTKLEEALKLPLQNATPINIRSCQEIFSNLSEKEILKYAREWQKKLQH